MSMKVNRCEFVHGLKCEQVSNRIAELEAENAKLRELVRIMHGELVSCEDNGYICGGQKFNERVSELGIEVDE